MKNLDKPGKIARLLGILDGSFSFDVMKPPKVHVAFFNGSFYQIENLKLSEDEFKKWSEKNIRDIDTVQVFEEKLANLTPEDFHCVSGDNGAVLIPKHKEPKVIVRPADPDLFMNLLKETSKDFVLQKKEPPQVEIINEPISKEEKKVRRKFNIPDEVKIKPKQIEQVKEDEITVTPVRKASGLMSDYGTTWGVNDSSLYKKIKYSPLN